MSPNNIYALKPIRSTTDINELTGCYFDHIPEAVTPGGRLFLSEEALSKSRVEIRTVGYKNFDGRRYWKLATVWFEGKPVMIIQNAGREGDDHAKRFVTDGAALLRMVAHILELVAAETEEPEVETVDATADDPALTYFYNCSLEEIQPKKPETC